MFKSGVDNLPVTINSRSKSETMRLLEMIASTFKAKLRERNVGEQKDKGIEGRVNLCVQ